MACKRQTPGCSCTSCGGGRPLCGCMVPDTLYSTYTYRNTLGTISTVSFTMAYSLTGWLGFPGWFADCVPVLNSQFCNIVGAGPSHFGNCYRRFAIRQSDCHSWIHVTTGLNCSVTTTGIQRNDAPTTGVTCGPFAVVITVTPGVVVWTITE